MKLRLIRKQQGESINRNRSFPQCLLFQDNITCLLHNTAEYPIQNKEEKV